MLPPPSVLAAFRQCQDAWSAPSGPRMKRRWTRRASDGPARRARATTAALLHIGLLICAVAVPRNAGAVNIQDQVKDWLDWITGKASPQPGGGSGSGASPAEPPGSSRTLDCQPRAGTTTCLLQCASHKSASTLSCARWLRQSTDPVIALSCRQMRIAVALLRSRRLAARAGTRAVSGHRLGLVSITAACGSAASL